MLLDVRAEDSMDGRSSSESSSKTLDNFALFIRFQEPVLQCPLHYFLHLKSSILGLI